VCCPGYNVTWRVVKINKRQALCLNEYIDIGSKKEPVQKSGKNTISKK